MSAGKGDTPRPVNKSKFDESFVKAFGERDISDYQKGQKTVKSYSKKTETLTSNQE